MRRFIEYPSGVVIGGALLFGALGGSCLEPTTPGTVAGDDIPSDSEGDAGGDATASDTAGVDAAPDSRPDAPRDVGRDADDCFRIPADPSDLLGRSCDGVGGLPTGICRDGQPRFRCVGGVWVGPPDPIDQGCYCSGPKYQCELQNFMCVQIGYAGITRARSRA